MDNVVYLYIKNIISNVKFCFHKKLVSRCIIKGQKSINVLVSKNEVKNKIEQEM